ncbi:MAG: bifunctional demethylmenaquinone methyltransferase/2-methoxy-6-polyprenyl-1,4-benzoquinol methylase UbiE [Verrucomicrobia bacterium]|nr:bifunctional demethylmenaquinone methyltransferase/2-methoxy-6-polyprenyl-1,4-benzoquinol methylase UbiE [Verrucomicrobiota bacterium]
MNASSATPAGPSRDGAPGMFNRIAHRYDFLNRMLSCGQDVRWRKRLARHFPDGTNLSVLDVATGTGDVLLMLHGFGRIGRGVGIDMAEKMLDIGRAKIRARGLQETFTLKTGDAAQIPETDGTYDVVTIAFGIRNVGNTATGLAELHRVLKPNGRALILEFSLPANPAMRKLYLFYFRHILPLVGGLISGDSYAYRYLNQTVETFPYGDAFLDLMRNAGFKNVSADPLTCGIAAIYRGEKPDDR